MSLESLGLPVREVYALVWHVLMMLCHNITSLLALSLAISAVNVSCKDSTKQDLVDFSLSFEVLQINKLLQQLLFRVLLTEVVRCLVHRGAGNLFLQSYADAPSTLIPVEKHLLVREEQTNQEC